VTHTPSWNFLWNHSARVSEVRSEVSLALASQATRRVFRTTSAFDSIPISLFICGLFFVSGNEKWYMRSGNCCSRFHTDAWDVFRGLSRCQAGSNSIRIR